MKQQQYIVIVAVFKDDQLHDYINETITINDINDFNTEINKAIKRLQDFYITEVNSDYLFTLSSITKL
jgi:hypothetical protein